MSKATTVFRVNPSHGFHIDVREDEYTCEIVVYQDVMGETQGVALSISEALELSRALEEIAGSRSNG